jgi:hypothetical protein
MMRTVAICCCMLFVATTAFAKEIVGRGNFRRAEAIQAAGAKGQATHVRGLATMNPRLNLKSSRILFVESGDSKKVSIVKAPLDRSEKVKVLTTAQANKLGFVTQAQAREQASYNKGVYGTRGRVLVKDLGITWENQSYAFKQTAPMGFNIPLWKDSNGKQVLGKVKSIYRTVPITGGVGESASGVTQTIR